MEPELGSRDARRSVENEGVGDQRGDLYLEGGRIAAVVPPDPAPAWPRSHVEVIDASALWILPGFVQVHLHLCQTLFRGLADGLRLDRWLSEAIWPLEAALTPETTRLSAEVGIWQLLAGGTTTILDMGTTRHAGAIAEAAAELGLRAFLGPAVMDRGPAQAQPLLRTQPEFFREIEDLASRWEDHDDGRLKIALCPRFVPSVSDRLWHELLEAPAFSRFLVHTHGAETRQELEESRALTGGSPVAYLSSLESAPARIKMAHGVWISSEDRRALRQMQAAVLHCPSSNFKLGSGLADVRSLREAGVVVGLGADGAACNNRLDPWQEMRLAAYIEGMLHGPDSVDPAAILRLATQGGALALGLEDEIGSLRAGKRADLILLDPDEDLAACGGETEPRSRREDIESERGERAESVLVFAGSPQMVQETWVQGRPVFRRQDMSALRRDLGPRAREAKRHLAERVGSRVLEPRQPT